MWLVCFVLISIIFKVYFLHISTFKRTSMLEMKHDTEVYLECAKYT